MTKEKLTLWVEKGIIKQGRARAVEKDFRYISHYIEDLIKKDYGLLK